MTTVSPGQGGSPPPPPAPTGGPSTPEGFVALAAVLVVLALAFGLTAVVVAGEREGGRPAAEGGGPTQTVAIELGDLFVKPDHIDVPTGTRLVVDVANTGDLVHTLNLEGEIGTDRLQSGESQTVDFGVIDADTEAWCTVPGHKEAGMLLAIAVAAPQPEPPGSEPPGSAEPPGTTEPGGGP